MRAVDALMERCRNRSARVLVAQVLVVFGSFLDRYRRALVVPTATSAGTGDTTSSATVSDKVVSAFDSLDGGEVGGSLTWRWG